MAYHCTDRWASATGSIAVARIKEVGQGAGSRVFLEHTPAALGNTGPSSQDLAECIKAANSAFRSLGRVEVFAQLGSGLVRLIITYDVA